MSHIVTLGELPVDIQKIAFQRALEQNRAAASNSLLWKAFSWGHTPEGYSYWYKVSTDSTSVTEDKVIEANSNNQDFNKTLAGEFPYPHGKKDPPLVMRVGTKPAPNTIEDSKTSVGEGLRFNTGKLRYDLVHPHAHEGMVRVLTKGSEKYAPRNWEKGMAWSTVLASMKRHIAAVEKGEDFDPETGELHINHVACNAHFLSAYYKIFPQGDDRPHNYLKTTKIGLDIDEVLCDWVGDWTTLRGMQHPTSWYFDRGLANKFDEMKEAGTLDQFYLDLKPLIKPEDIPFEPHCYITSRPVDSAVTEQWLAVHGFPARPVFTTAVGASKVDIAKCEGLDIFVDDNFDNFRALNNAGVTCFLMDAKHNQRYDVGARRIKNLKELV